MGDPQGFITPGTMGPGRTVEWGTPPELFRALDLELGPFTLDAAADGAHIAKCAHFITPEQNALVGDWGLTGSRVWLNPPYGRLMPAFMAKAAEQAQRGRLVVCCVPARTDTAWWADSVMAHASEVRLIRGRLKYENWSDGELSGSTSAPFPSCVVIFGRSTPSASTPPDRLSSFQPPRFGYIDRQGAWLFKPWGVA